MLILRLRSEEATVSYNKLGTRTSAPVPYTKDKIKGIQADIEVTGYLAGKDFFAYKLTSKDRAFSLDEQFRLLAMLGFKTVPVYRYPTQKDNQTVNSLIRIKTRFGDFDSYWLDTATNEEYQLPVLTTIKASRWDVDPAGRVFKRITTDLGEFDILDQRAPEYFQVGNEIKVQGDKVTPYQTSTIMEPTPTHCPRCNNPLKNLQVAGDLPLILKCTNPTCKLLKLTQEPTVGVEPETEATQDDTEHQDSTAVTEEAPVSEEVGTALGLTVLNVEAKIPEDIAEKITIITETPEDLSLLTADMNVSYIITKSKRSVTKASRAVYNETHIPLLGVDELAKVVEDMERQIKEEKSDGWN